jgi:hypothetical protein
VRRFGDRIRGISWGRIGLDQGEHLGWLDLSALVDGQVEGLNRQLAEDDDPARWAEMIETASEWL